MDVCLLPSSSLVLSCGCWSGGSKFRSVHRPRSALPEVPPVVTKYNGCLFGALMSRGSVGRNISLSMFGDSRSSDGFIDATFYLINLDGKAIV